MTKPIFFHTGGGDLAVTYLRPYIEAGHRRDGAPALTAVRVRALDALDRVLAEPRYLVEGKLRPGEILLVANTRILHARTTFTDVPGAERMLLRMWLRRPPARP